MLNIKTNISKVVKNEFKNYRRAIDRATQRTNREVAKKVITEYSQDLRTDWTLKASRIKKQFKQFNKRGGTAVIVRGYGKKGLPLADYQTRKTATGISYKLRKTDSTHIMGGSFKAKMKSGHKGMFLRDENKYMKSRKGKTKHTQFIEEKFGPNPTLMFGTRENMRKHQMVVEKSYPSILKRNIDYYTRNAGRR